MLKNNKGVTILSLVITIIILFILAGVSMNTGFSVMNDVRCGRIISNMALVKAKAEVIYEDYQFYNNDTDYLAGEGAYQIDSTTYKLENVSISAEEVKLIAEGAETSEAEVLNWDWYKWNSSTLQAQGLDQTILGENEYLYVNYEHQEIIYSVGTSYDNENYFYSMTGLNNMYKNK